MNSAHLHLLFNHVPILGSAFGCAWMLWRYRRTGVSVPLRYTRLALGRSR